MQDVQPVLLSLPGLGGATMPQILLGGTEYGTADGRNGSSRTGIWSFCSETLDAALKLLLIIASVYKLVALPTIRVSFQQHRWWLQRKIVIPHLPTV
jgi:hypothetical protein